MFFLELSCFFYDPTDVGNLISVSSAFSKSSLNIWNFMVHVLLKPGLENFEHYFAGMWDECNCVVVWTFFGIAFLWDWNENWHFPVLWPLLSVTIGFSNLKLLSNNYHVWTLIGSWFKQTNWKKKIFKIKYSHFQTKIKPIDFAASGPALKKTVEDVLQTEEKWGLGRNKEKLKW